MSGSAWGAELNGEGLRCMRLAALGILATESTAPPAHDDILVVDGGAIVSVLQMHMFRAFYQSAQFINWPAQSRNYRLGAQFINRMRNLEIESRASNERSVHVLYIA